jgi:hypothetical protein
VIANELRGTCDALYAALERHDAEGMDNDRDFCARLDALVFCCEGCDWWFEQSEMAQDDKRDRWACDECAA